ncbi:MAG: CDP-alcohol phosphatidyltransferase family protein, partial [Gammaproteobacteria bacterium]|nr:CDP-alcohol phosphatidyltransferase family protein [Gammaproteobacteria bacterium]
MYPQLNVATALTWLRIAAIPAVAVVFYWPGEWSRPAASMVFTLACITDLLDGYLARRMGQTSEFGAFLDPVADKLMVAVALVLILQADPRITI